MKFLLALLAGASLAALPVGLAGAADSPPEPCLATTVTDPAGDQIADPIPLLNVPAAGSKTEDNTDLRGVFFNFKDGVLTANLVVTNLTKEVSGSALMDGMSYNVAFNEPENTHELIQARNDGGEFTFRYQTWTVLPGDLLRTPSWVETTGTVHEGPMGVISIVMPKELAKAGIKFDNVYARMSLTSAEEEEVAYTTADLAPDDGTASTKSYTVTECPAEAAPTTDTTATTTEPPAQQPPAQQPPQQQPPAQQPPQQTGPPAPGSPLPATGTLSADAAADKGKRKTAAKRGVRARLRCSVQCKVRATATITKQTARKLRLGRKAMKIGSGKATITKAGRVPFYVKMTKKAKRALKRKGVRKFALKVSFVVTDMQGGQVKKITRKSTLR